MASIPSALAESAKTFVLARSTPLAALGVTLEEYRHQASGARHLHLASEDPVNAFMLGLLTPPVDDSGLTHVLEHMVLCGGRGFSGRRAFFDMLWRSACITMNASASDDCTGYHFATRHPRDFHNLLQVYLDCLFRPRLDGQDFDQEAHRLEYGDSGDTPVRRGVVLSEMRGAMSEPRIALQAALARHLFPGSAYGFNTGGDPRVLPQLTLEQVRRYHRRAYHPACAVFMSTGNLPARAHHPAIQDIAFDGWDEAATPALDPAQLEPSLLPAPVAVSEQRAAAEGAPAQVAIAWLLGSRANPRDLLLARLLAALMLDHSACPLRRVLQSGRFTGAPSGACGLDESRRRLSLCIAMEGADPAQAGALEEALLAAISQRLAAGIPAGETDAALDRIELGLRAVGTRRYPHGLDLLARMLTPVLHGGDPVAQLDLLPALTALRADLARPGYLESCLRGALLDNPHRVRLSLESEPAAAETRASVVELIGRDGSQAPLAPLPPIAAAGEPARALPSLVPADLVSLPASMDPPLAIRPGLRLHRRARACTGLVHQVLALRLPVLDPALADILPLWLACVGKLAQGELDAADSARRIGRASSGLHMTLRVAGDWQDSSRAHAAIVMRASCLLRHQGELAVLMQQALDETRFDDPELLDSVLQRARARLRASALAQGHLVAQRWAAAGASVAGALIQHWQGLAVLTRLSLLLESSDRGARLQSAARSLGALTRRLRQCPRDALVVADADGLGATADQLAETWAAPRDGIAGPWTAADLPLRPSPGDRALQMDLPVGHAARTIATVAPGHGDAPALAVMGPLLAAGVLHDQIREQGGAYGTGAGYDLDSGVFRLFSFRDPDPLRSLEAFDGAMDWLASCLDRKGELARGIARAKLAVMRELERSESAAHMAMAPFHDGLLGRDAGMTYGFREAVLGVQAGDLARVFETRLRGAGSTSVVMAGAAMLERVPPAMSIEGI